MAIPSRCSWQARGMTSHGQEARDSSWYSFETRSHPVCCLPVTTPALTRHPSRTSRGAPKGSPPQMRRGGALGDGLVLNRKYRNSSHARDAFATSRRATRRTCAFDEAGLSPLHQAPPKLAISSGVRAWLATDERGKEPGLFRAGAAAGRRPSHSEGNSCPLGSQERSTSDGFRSASRELPDLLRGRLHDIREAVVEESGVNTRDYPSEDDGILTRIAG